jgi:tetratricopeptide (TPR) repeat protein
MATNPKRIRYISIWLSPFMAVALIALISSVPSEPLKKERTGTPIDLADKELREMNYPKADSIYSSELRKNPGNADLYWKLARLQVSIGESIPSEQADAELQHFHKAAEYARTSISLDSTNSKGHTWLAASLAIMADKIGNKEKITRAKEIKRELDTALRLNPNDETALSLLGSYYREAANIGWFKRVVANTFIGDVPKGNYELAEKAFRKSIALDPQIIRNYHELALICIEKDNREEALRLMKIAIEKPIIFTSDRRRIEKMRALLKKYSQSQ